MSKICNGVILKGKNVTQKILEIFWTKKSRLTIFKNDSQSPSTRVFDMQFCSMSKKTAYGKKWLFNIYTLVPHCGDSFRSPPVLLACPWIFIWGVSYKGSALSTLLSGAHAKQHTVKLAQLKLLNSGIYWIIYNIS